MKEMRFDMLKFDERGLLPAVVQDAATGHVLMVAWMNEESLRRSLETGYSHFWSRSRKALWKKGETSGHLQRIISLAYDCDGDTLLVTVEQTGPACHTGEKSCFYRWLQPPPGGAPSPAGRWRVLAELESVLADRRANPRASSYTNRLFSEEGLVQEKVLEESREVVEASRGEDGDHLVWEAADLLYHLMVLLAARGLGLDQVCLELGRRFGNPPKKGAAG